MAMWNPWRGCHKCSEGCKYCYIHKGDAKRGMDTNNIIKTDNFNAPIAKNSKGEYKIKSGQTVYLCFSTDFLIEEADEWRDDWGNGYNNVIVGCTIENQDRADFRLKIFSNLPIKHKNIICQPLIEEINIEKYLDTVELVIVGGESDKNARPLNYNWVLSIRNQCILKNVKFQFRQCGTHFIKDGKEYVLKVKDLCSQAKKANINV